ncbi:hypothetical protein V6Z93_000001 [Aspergillus fumigatus]
MAPGFDDCDRILPRLVVVLTESEVVQQDIVATEESLAAAAKPRVADSVIVVDLRDRSELSARSRFEPLRRALEREAEEARARKAGCLPSVFRSSPSVALRKDVAPCQPTVGAALRLHKSVSSEWIQAGRHIGIPS